jgi:diaminopimelate decarboxylase
MLYTKNENMPLTTEITVKGNLGVGGCDLVELGKEFGTPLWVIDEETLRDTCRRYVNSLHEAYANSEVLFASKALSTIGTLKVIAEEGLGVDVVSGGELFIALKAGVAPEKIFFHGNNKSKLELEEALSAGVGYVVVDSLYELELLNTVAAAAGKVQQILIRVTPGIEAHTHEFIKTGQFDSKFGTHLERVTEFIEEIKKRKHIDLQGLHVHIGSQILEINPFAFAVEKMCDLLVKIKQKNGLDLNILNVGGGLGICYMPKEVPAPIEQYTQMIGKELTYQLQHKGIKPPKLYIEPGRSIVGRSGLTIYTVGSIKEIKGIRTYVAVDGGMADNPRPITYQAKYDAGLANKPSARRTHIVTVAGKFCESGDILLKDIVLPQVETGDTLVVFGTGAYNYAMSSNYNQTPRPAMVMVNNGQAKVLVKRETYADLIRNMSA